MSELSRLERIVNKINAEYGTKNFRPAECIYQDGQYYIKAFGKVIWESGNDIDENESSIEVCTWIYINKYILASIYTKQLEMLREDLSSILSNSPHLTENEWTRDMVSEEILTHIENEINFYEEL
jgi:hypothetical protein